MELKYPNFPLYLFLFLSFSLTGCGMLLPPMFESVSSESKRITSPDGLVDAILIFRDSGATTRGTHKLFLLPKGKVVEESKDRPVLNAEINLITLLWGKNKELFIDCESATISHFSNFWQSKDIQDYAYIVKIRISPKCLL